MEAERRGMEADQAGCSDYCAGMGKLYGALWKLKDYEDTGVSPDEIERMKTEGERCW